MDWLTHCEITHQHYHCSTCEHQEKQEKIALKSHKTVHELVCELHYHFPLLSTRGNLRIKEFKKGSLRLTYYQRLALVPTLNCWQWFCETLC